MSASEDRAAIAAIVRRVGFGPTMDHVAAVVADDAELLAQCVDAYGPAGVLDALAATCRERAESASGDAARAWAADAETMERAGAKVTGRQDDTRRDLWAGVAGVVAIAVAVAVWF